MTSRLKILVAAVGIAVALAVVVYEGRDRALNPLSQALSTPALANLDWHEAPKPLPAHRFETVAAKEFTLARYKGKVILLNLWATWCAPCLREMPDLDALAGALNSDRFEVVTISMDTTGPEKPLRFWARLGLENLELLMDPKGRFMWNVGARGLPLTLILDAQGYEVARHTGPAEWADKQVVEALRKITDVLLDGES